MFQNQVVCYDFVIIDVQFESCGVQFLDVGGIVGVVLFFDVIVCILVFCVILFSEEFWEIVVVFFDFQFKGIYWVLGNINEDFVGSLSFGLIVIWDVRVRKVQNGNLDVVF